MAEETKQESTSPVSVNEEDRFTYKKEDVTN